MVKVTVYWPVPTSATEAAQFSVEREMAAVPESTMSPEQILAREAFPPPALHPEIGNRKLKVTALPAEVKSFPFALVIAPAEDV